MPRSIESIAVDLRSYLDVEIIVNNDDSIAIGKALTIHRRALEDKTVQGLLSLLVPWFRGWELTCSAAGMSKEDSERWIRRHFEAVCYASCHQG